MAEQSFSVRFSGPAVESGRMPIRDLVPSLLAMGQLFEQVNDRSNPGMPPVALDVQAIGRGSFALHLIVAQIESGSISLLTSQSATALSNLISLVTGGGGILRYLRAKRGRAVVNQEPVRPGWVRVTFDGDNTTVEARTTAVDMAEDIRIRRIVRDAVAPLGTPGIEEITITTGTPDGDLTLTKGDAPSLLEVEPDVPVDLRPPYDAEMILAIDSPALTRRNGAWRFHGGPRGLFWAQVIDDGFLDDVDFHRETFAADDALRCVVRFEQIMDSDGAAHDRITVIRVLEHLRESSQQLQLGFTNKSDH